MFDYKCEHGGMCVTGIKSASYTKDLILGKIICTGL